MTHRRHCRCGCPQPRGSVAGDLLRAVWRPLRGWRADREPAPGLPVPAWVVEALSEPDPTGER
ncbi:MAG TPA: hypothetical protein VMU20_15565 [Candidatus Dormibacteraeota bacterium]|nr:hypothetical protein [Candidatus Dormibacteraeota bacterium]